MPLTPEAFARQLLQLRESLLLNRDEAAKQAGVSERQWQRWENAESIPHSSNLQKILQAFELDPSYFGIEETPVSNQLLEAVNAKLDALLEAMRILATGLSLPDDLAEQLLLTLLQAEVDAQADTSADTPARARTASGAPA